MHTKSTMSRMWGWGGGGRWLVQQVSDPQFSHVVVPALLLIIDDWSLSLATDKINQDVMINTVSVVVNHT